MMERCFPSCIIKCLYVFQVGIIIANAQYYNDFNRKPIVQLANKCLIQGIIDRADDRGEFFAFLGIPYAKPPVLDKRFREPEPYIGWKAGKMMHANRYGPPCPQWDITRPAQEFNNEIGDENCLHLNVFTHEIPSEEADDHPMLPVIVYIHGGAFFLGEAQDHGPRRLMRHLDASKVLVTLQYRLGVLGFLSTGDSESPGNYGLLDTVLALRWVKDNIHAFGGNPNHITIVGHSAGAAIVHMMLMSPRAKGLFSAAIAMSGSALCDWAIEESPREFAETVAEEVGCSTETSATLVRCLRSKPVIELIRAGASTLKYGFFPLRTAPVVDAGMRESPFLLDHPRELVAQGRFQKVPLVAGITSNEGMFIYLHIQLQYRQDIRNVTLLQDILKNSIIAATDKGLDEDYLWKAVKRVYFVDVDYSNMGSVARSMMEVLGDSVFYGCVDDMIRAHANHAPTYAYKFDYRIGPSNAKKLIDAAKLDPGIEQNTYLGVSHGDDLPLLFNMSVTAGHYKPKEFYDVSSKFVALWSSFANSREPTHVDSDAIKLFNLLPWPRYKSNNRLYYSIGSEMALVPSFRNRELSSWRHIYLEAQRLALTEDPSPEPYRTIMWILAAVGAFLLLSCLIFVILFAISRRGSSYSTNG